MLEPRVVARRFLAQAENWEREWREGIAALDILIRGLPSSHRHFFEVVLVDSPISATTWERWVRGVGVPHPATWRALLPLLRAALDLDGPAADDSPPADDPDEASPVDLRGAPGDFVSALCRAAIAFSRVSDPNGAPLLPPPARNQARALLAPLLPLLDDQRPERYRLGAEAALTLELLASEPLELAEASRLSLSAVNCFDLLTELEKWEPIAYAGWTYRELAILGYALAVLVARITGDSKLARRWLGELGRRVSAASASTALPPASSSRTSVTTALRRWLRGLPPAARARAEPAIQTVVQRLTT
jgi:hypothetical protein